MAVVKTTSPWPWVAAPKASPRYVEPSSSTSSASGNCHLDIVHNAAAGDRRDDLALQLYAGERRILALRCKALGLDRPLAFWIEHDDVGWRSGFESPDAADPVIEPKRADGCQGNAFDELRQRQAAFEDEAHAQAECRLKAADPERRVVELAEL